MTIRFRLALPALFLGLAAAFPALAQTEVSIGHGTAAHFDVLFVGVEKGIFKENGLDVKLVPLNRPSDHPPALLSGSIQFGYASPTVFLQATQNGVDIAAVAGASREWADDPDVGLIAGKDKGIAAPADLAGKKVGVSGLNTNMHIMMTHWLRGTGVDPSTVQFVEVPIQNGADALASGDIDAMALLEPHRSRALKRGVGTEVANYIADVQDGALMGVWAVSRSWAEDNPEAVKAFREAMNASIAYIEAHPEVIAQVEEKYLGYSSGKTHQPTIDLTPQDFDIWVTVGNEAGILSGIPDAAALMIP